MKSSRKLSLKSPRKTDVPSPQATVLDAAKLHRYRMDLGTCSSLLAALLESNSDSVFSINKDYQYTSFNSTHAALTKALYGVKIKDGMNVLEAMSVPADRQVAKSNLDRALRGEHLQEEAKSGEHDRERKHFVVRHEPLRGSDGKVKGVLVLARDTTELNSAHAKLQIAQSRLAQFVNTNTVGVVVAKAAGAVVEANDYYLDLVGCSRQELIDEKVNWKVFTPPEHMPADARAIEELKTTGVCHPYEKEYLRRDGTRVWVELVDSYLGGPDQLIVAIAKDISKRKRVEAALVDSEERYRHLTQLAGLGILMYDVDGNLLLANDLIARYMESSEKNLVGKSCLDLFGNVLGSEVLARVKKAVKSGVTEKYESEVELPLGRCWLRSHYTPIRNAQNEFIGVQVISEDITELKSLAIDRQRYMEQVEKDNIALERKHAALLEVTSLLQAERNRLGQEFQANKRLTIDPLLEQLKVKAGKSLQSTISALEAAISGIASPLLQQLIVAFADLTPRELEVCGLIAKGNSSKEIAEIFSISLLTVHKLRQRIRTKLQLSGDDTDLGTYLRAQKARSEP